MRPHRWDKSLTQTTVPQPSASSINWRAIAGMPVASMQTLNPRPPVSLLENTASKSSFSGSWVSAHAPTTLATKWGLQS